MTLVSRPNTVSLVISLNSTPPKPQAATVPMAFIWTGGLGGSTGSPQHTASATSVGHARPVIPPFDPTTGGLPRGRYLCSVDEIEALLVEAFEDSSTRSECFQHWLQAKAMLDALAAGLVQAAWVGGSFTTTKKDPDDVDAVFLLDAQVFDDLSNTSKGKINKFNQKDWLRKKTGLRVESFIIVRRPVANPWDREGLDPEALEYFSLRGRWDDWWMRARTDEDKTTPPTLVDAEPVRGYLEVIWP